MNRRARGRTWELGVLALAAWLTGCGYALMEPSAGVPGDVRRLYVETDDGRESDPVIADALGRELRRLVRTEGRFKLAETAARADAVLRVHIVSSLTRPVAFDKYDDVLDYETTLRVDAALADGTGDVLWEHDRIGATRSHGAVAGAVVTSSSSFQSSERLRPENLQEFDTIQLGEQRVQHARRALAQDIARTIYQLMTESR
jgi:outer membrane lipopolysaccharide assembly protein LptE/RlpB